MLRTFCFASLLVFSSLANARVFNINKERFAGYFSVTGGGSHIGANGISDAAGTGLEYSEETKYNFTGEFGFAYSLPKLTVRFGFEVFKPNVLSSTVANGTSDLYSAESSIQGFIPKLGIDVNLHGNAQSRSFINVSGGLADVKLNNDYALTTDGQALYSGVSDHSVEAKGSGTLLSASLGYEGLLSDTNTIVVEFGYRQLNINNLKYSRGATTFNPSGTGSTTVTSGDKVVKSDGSTRDLNLSGPFLSIGFRFYM